VKPADSAFSLMDSMVCIVGVFMDKDSREHWID